MRNFAYGCWAVIIGCFELLRMYKTGGYRHEAFGTDNHKKIRISRVEYLRTWGSGHLRARWRRAWAARWSDGKRSYTMMLLARLRLKTPRSTDGAIDLMLKENGY